MKKTKSINDKNVPKSSPPLQIEKNDNKDTQIQKPIKLEKTQTQYYHIKKKEDIHFENDSSFSQSNAGQNDQTLTNIIQNTQNSNNNRLFSDEDIKNSIAREEQLRQEIEEGINKFKNTQINNQSNEQNNGINNQRNNQNNIDLEGLMPLQASKELSVKPELSTIQQQQNTLFDTNQSIQNNLISPSSIIPLSTLSQNSHQVSSQQDLLSDFLRQTQQMKLKLSSKNLNFHNQLAFDKTLNKNQGGAGSQMSHFGSLQHHLKQPSEIIREKQKKYQVSSPIEMKLNAQNANQTIVNDKFWQQKQFDVRSKYNKSRDISYKIDAARSRQEDRFRQTFSSGSIVESSLSQMKDLNDNEKQLLAVLGGESLEADSLSHMPRELKTIDQVINDRKLLLSEMSERVKEIESQYQTGGDQGFRIKPSKRVEFRQNNNDTQNSPSKQSQSKMSKTSYFRNFSRAAPFKQNSTAQQNRAHTSDQTDNLSHPSIQLTMPNIQSGNSILRNLSRASSTFNININTNNYFLQSQQQQNMQPPMSATSMFSNQNHSQSMSNLLLLSPTSNQMTNVSSQGYSNINLPMRSQDGFQIQSPTLEQLSLQTHKKHQSQEIEQKLKQGKKLIQIPENRRNIILGQPQSRKEAENLQEWFQEMLIKVDKELDISKEKRIDLKMNVYHATFLEVARQVSVQCINRGELLKLIWSGFFKDLYLQLKSQKDKFDKLEKQLKDELDDQNIFYLDQLKRKNGETENLNLVIDDFKSKLTLLAKNLADQRIESERWKLKCENIMAKYKENKFKLMMADSEKSRSRIELGIYSPLNKNSRNENMPRLDLGNLNSQELILDLKSEGFLKKNKKESQRDLPTQRLNIDLMSNANNEDTNSAKGSRKSDRNLAVTQKRRGPPEIFIPQVITPRVKAARHQPVFDKQTDTNDFLDFICKEKAVQTIGVGNLISNIAEEDFKKQKDPSKQQSVNVTFMGNVSFEQDIDNILRIETQMHEEQEQKLLQGQDLATHEVQYVTIEDGQKIIKPHKSQHDQKFQELQKRDLLGSKALEILNEHDKLNLYRDSQAKDNNDGVVKIDDENEININKNRTMQSFASGLKAGLMQKVITKLKENFKQKEILIKQLIDENKDLFMQLDIEKAKFNQLVQFKNQDQEQLMELQQKYEQTHNQLNKAKTRHTYYKNLIQELSDLDDVRRKLNLSVSDVDAVDGNNDADSQDFSNELGEKFKSFDSKKPHKNTQLQLGVSPPGKQNKKFSKIKGMGGANGQTLTGSSRKPRNTVALESGVVLLDSLQSSEMNKNGEIFQFDDWGLDNMNDDGDFLLDDITPDDLSDNTLQDNLSQNSRFVSQNQKSNKNVRKSEIRRKAVQFHQSQPFISKLVKKLHVPRFQRLSCPLKLLLRTINASYLALINIYKNELSDLKNSFNLKQNCVEFMYDSFLRGCGIKQIAEKKFAQTISSVIKYKPKIFRVNIFGRFLTLYDPIDKESFKFYLVCLNYLLNISTFGYIVPNTDQDEIHYAPYIRVNDFMRNYFEGRIPIEEYQELKIQIDKLKESDFKKNRNTFIVEMDKALEILMIQHQEMLHKQKGYVQELFNALDVNIKLKCLIYILQHYQLDIIDFQAFYLLILHVETRKFTFQQVKTLFEKNCEIIAVQSKKDAKKYLTIESFISLCFQEKLFSIENQHRLLGIEDKNDIDILYERVLKFKQNYKKEMENLNRRFYHIHQYFRDLIQLIQTLLEGYTPEKLKRKSKYIWTLIRLIEEESNRSYLDIHAQKFMGGLDCFTFVNQGWLLLEEQRNVFDVSFMNKRSSMSSSKRGTVDEDFITFSTMTKLKNPVETTNEQVNLQSFGIGGNHQNEGLRANRSSVNSQQQSRKNSARKNTRL